MSANPATAPAASAAVKRIAIIAPSGRSAAALRGPLIDDLVARRHRVLCLSPVMTAGDVAELATRGAETRPWPEPESFLRLVADHRQASALRGIVAGWQPHVALAYGETTLAAGLAAAGAARVPHRVALINGLPPSFEREARQLRRPLASATTLLCQNRDDLSRLRAAGLVRSDQPAFVVAGSGVDLVHHALQPLPGLADGLVFCMIATLDRRRGVADYLAAAALLKPMAPNARFLLAGPVPPGDADIPKLLAQAAGTVEYVGAVSDVRPLLARTHVFVYASHGEGCPRAAQEALAAGRPIVTTNAPGCRDMVDERVNGCLVTPGDAQALADGMASFLRRPDLIASAARASRVKAERNFSVSDICAATRQALGLA